MLGHLRGGRASMLNPKLGELLDRVRALRPDFAVLTGDVIWGDIEQRPPRRDTVLAEWNALDSALATLHIPIYRAPGNHDITDVQSRDIWLQRYGPLPRVVAVGGSRLILLASAFIPPDGDTSVMRYVSGVDLDTGQVAFLRRTLADTGYAHTFVFVHHLLWWEPDSGRWWREVHPLLAAAHVDNVFSGDYGPMKFSTMEKDGVRYYQGAIELQVDLYRLRHIPSSRMLSSQFDNFFHVRVHRDTAAVTVQTLGTRSLEEFTPARYQAIEEPLPLRERLAPLYDTTKKKLVWGVMVVGLLGAGMAIGWLLRGRRA